MSIEAEFFSMRFVVVVYVPIFLNFINRRLFCHFETNDYANLLLIRLQILLLSLYQH